MALQRGLFSGKFLVGSIVSTLVAGSVILAPSVRSYEIPHDEFPSLEILLGGGGSGGSGYKFTKSEMCFMKKINRKRKANDLNGLRFDKQLSYVGRRAAIKMARKKAVLHTENLGGKVTKWTALGENVGKGSSCKHFFKAFWNSSAHRANILGHWKHLGVGTKWRNGRLYVSQVFQYKKDPGNVWHRP